MVDQRAAHHAADSLQHVTVVLDFDGTITLDDCLRLVLARHVPQWPALMAAADEGELTQVGALETAVGLLRPPREQVLQEIADAAVLRAGFPAFLERLRAGHGRAVVISVGFRDGIQAVWRRKGLPAILTYAAELADDGPSYRLVLDPQFGDCPICGPRHCKGSVVRSLRRRGDLIVAFGDGSRDLCMAREADVVFARAELARLCRRETIPWFPLEDFTRAWQTLLEHLANNSEV